MLPPGSTRLVDLNLKLAIPPGVYLQLRSCSGLALRGVTTVGGVIDSDYRGPIKAILHNSGDQNVVIAKGQRVTSGVFLPTLPVCSSKQQMFFLRLSEECLDSDRLISFFFVCIVMLFSFFTLHSIQNLLQIRNDDH